MSTARSYKEDKHGSPAHGKPEKTRHPFRTALWISLILAALILWQLNPVIHALGATRHGLQHAEGTRSAIKAVLTVFYQKLHHAVSPLLARTGS